MLNSLYKLIYNTYFQLTEEQLRTLENLYRTLYIRSKIICHNVLTCDYQINTKESFIQAETNDCEDYLKADKRFVG